MESKYQKYYDALKGKDFSSPISKYTSALSNAKTKVESAEAIINSSQWIEKGLEIIKGSILPSLKEQESQMEQGIAALSTAVGKIDSLVGKLEALDAACKSYSSCEDEEKKKTYLSKVHSLESEADGIINEINGISFNFTSQKTSFESHISNLEEATKRLEIDFKNRIFSSDPAINDKIRKLIGDVDDPNSYEAVHDNLTSFRKDILVIDPETGQTLNRDDVLNMKPGETKRLLVRLPVNTGMIDKISRTTADNCGSTITRTYSDIDPDPNKVQTVRRSSNTWPDNMNLLHQNYYEWVITATGTGRKTISQTVEYSTDASRGANLKAMTRIKINIQ